MWSELIGYSDIAKKLGKDEMAVRTRKAYLSHDPFCSAGIFTVQFFSHGYLLF